MGWVTTAPDPPGVTAAGTGLDMMVQRVVMLHLGGKGCCAAHSGDPPGGRLGLGPCPFFPCTCKAQAQPGMTMPRQALQHPRRASPAPMGLLAVPMDFSQKLGAEEEDS